ncbi:penicillin acylase family protein [Paracoccus alkanivorans]|uniref:Penicillin acylase family protein n=1 Tax=Paracoccus alkanivorans TaxID=2116655 RepID=A0A3M0MXT9_9RHOB|nr:penicillin acylase family protein [Paracoccus alkanivorans]RMC36177.1 penicillin acylase family protein [Paracoccus alkanivorans]
MLTLFRWLLRLTVAMILLLVTGTVLIWYFAIRSLPDYDAGYEMAGLSAPVEIVRSTENVPHIFGQSDEDVFFALGVTHAQDRLFQMTVLRRAAQGRLSEIYGSSAFALDDLARRLGLYDRAAASVEAQDPEALAALEAYSAGINEWIRQVNEGAMGKGAPEFFLFPDQIAYWQPADSLAILKLLAASSSRSIEEEVLRARLSLAWPEHGPELQSPDGTARPSYSSLFPGARLGIPQSRRTPGHPMDLRGFLRPGMGLGANGFAAASERTAANGSLLANDLQAPLTVPSLYYLVRLELSTGGAIGATIPGIPVLWSGRNQHLAWGLTPAAVDDADIYMEEVKPGASDSYRGVSGWTQFQTERTLIRIMDGQNQTITLRETENGPLVPLIDPGLQDVTPYGHVASLRWTGLSRQDRTISALIGLMRSGDRASAMGAMAQTVAPAMTVTLADSGGVQQFTAGAVPQRAAEHPTGGGMPAPGWLPEARWTGIAQAADLAPGTPSGQDMTIATEEARDGTRYKRLSYLLEDREIHSRDSFIATQLDVVSPAARALLPLVGANLWFSGEPAAAGTPERQRQDALNLLAEWDGEMSEHLPEPLIYAAWMRELQKRLIQDELGPLADDITQLRPAFIDAVFRNRNGAARWCNIIQSAPDEDCTTIARQALDRAILDLTDRFGPQVTSWRWGDLHQARHDHPALGRISGLGWVMNLTQSVSGGEFTLARSGLLGGGDNPYEAVSGAAYRGVYDLADPDSSVFIISTGQSGHPFSRHYDDLAELWRRGEYIGMSLDPDLARAAAVGVTELIPAK